MRAQNIFVRARRVNVRTKSDHVRAQNNKTRACIINVCLQSDKVRTPHEYMPARDLSVRADGIHVRNQLRYDDKTEKKSHIIKQLLKYIKYLCRQIIFIYSSPFVSVPEIR